MAASSATDTTSKTTEGTNSTTTEDCSIEDLQKEIEMLKKKIIDERLKLCDKTVVQVAEAIGNKIHATLDYGSALWYWEFPQLKY